MASAWLSASRLKSLNFLQGNIKNIIKQQARTTIVVERAFPIRDFRENQTPQFKKKDYIYHYAETVNYKDAEVECIFIQDHEEHKMGEIKSVNAKYFRKMLFPYYAVYACEDNRRIWNHILATDEDNEADQQDMIDITALRLSKQHLVFPWEQDTEVTKSRIRYELRTRGFFVPEAAISLLSGEVSDPGDYVLMIQINKGRSVFMRYSVIKDLTTNVYKECDEPLKIIDNLHCVVEPSGDTVPPTQEQIEAAGRVGEVEEHRVVERTQTIPNEDK